MSSGSHPIVQPLAQAQQALPTHGRIRTGVNTGKFPKALDTFRFTSPDEDAINRLAQIYGAKEGPRPWNNKKANPPEQFEIISDTKVIAMVMVPASVEINYELWGSGFRRRSCDGEHVIVRSLKGQGKARTVETLEGGCICVGKDKLECNPVTRLNVILPDLPFRGLWMLQSSGWNIFKEMPGMANLAGQMKPGEMIKGRLSLQKRQSGGGSKKFVVPVIELDESYDELTGARELEAPDTVQLEGPSQVDPMLALEEEVIDAEIVED